MGGQLIPVVGRSLETRSAERQGASNKAGPILLKLNIALLNLVMKRNHHISVCPAQCMASKCNRAAGPSEKRVLISVAPRAQTAGS